ncbi:MAG: acyl-CoA dehydrogenase family protein [Polyangiaceae bacterium]
MTTCFDSALDYAQHRVQFAGKPIAAHQLVQAKFAGCPARSRAPAPWRSR